MKTIARGSSSGVLRAGQQVIRSDAEFRKLWDTHSARTSPRPDPPKVDFAREMVIAVFLGQKSTGGYSIEILDASLKDKEMVISWKKAAPDGGIVSQAFTQPHHMVVVPRTDRPVRFVETK